jgi:hypothetical protein
VLFYYNTVRIATIGDTSNVHIWRVIGEGHVWTELLETSLAFGAVVIRVNQTTYCSDVAGPKLGDCRADVGDTAYDLMSGNAWIDCGHRAPLVSDLVEIRVADTAEKDFDLNVVFAGIPS